MFEPMVQQQGLVLRNYFLRDGRTMFQDFNKNQGIVPVASDRDQRSQQTRNVDTMLQNS